MRKIKLGEVLDVKRGASISGEYYATEGDLIRLTLGNFNYPGGGFKPNTSKDDIYYIGPVRDEFIMKKGDIITPLTEQVRGLLGETAIIPESGKYVQNGDIGKIIPNEKVLDKSFAAYLISSPVIKAQLDAAAQQTKIRHTSPDKIKDCITWIPAINEQKKIGKMMDDINEKIKTNNRINSELETMAKTIYDYWFLQFEFPNEEGKPYKSSGGKMAWNDELKREIPEGWKVESLGDICKFSNGINYDKNDPGDTQYKIVNVRNITASSLMLDDSDFDVLKLKKSLGDKYIVDDGDILIARSGTPGAVRLLENPDGKTIYCGFIICGKPYNRNHKLLITYSLKQLEGTSATKTGGSILQNVSQETLKVIKVVIPNRFVLDKFNQTIQKNINMIVSKTKENQELASLRDFLLPMLMNGQVTFKEKDAQ